MKSTKVIIFFLLISLQLFSYINVISQTEEANIHFEFSEPFPVHLHCEDVIAPYNGATWQSIEIGSSTIGDLQNLIKSFHPSYLKTTFNSGQFVEFTIPYQTSITFEIPARISACSDPETKVVTALSFSDGFDTDISDLVIEYGEPDVVTWDFSPETRVAFWFEKGIASAAVEAKANGANLIFTNNASEEAIISACIVRGRRITDKGYMEASAEDTDSIGTYGRRTMRVNLPSMDDLEQAQYIADFELLRRKDPIGQVQAISCISHAKLGGGQHTHQLARTIGDFITITETQTGHSQDHVIVGEAHELGEAATYLKTTWYLEPATARSWLHVGDEIGAYGAEDTLRYIPY